MWRVSIFFSSEMIWIRKLSWYMLSQFLEPLQYFQALQVESFIVEDAGIIQLLVQLDIDILIRVQQAKAGQHLLYRGGP
jgi:hypothetical protein